MNIYKIVLKEIYHRSNSFLSGALLICVVLSGLLISTSLVRSFDQESEVALQKHADESNATLKKLENEIRKEMKGLGFNIYIFPEGQDLKEVYSQGYASKTMPESYVTKLAETKTLSKINHLLPSLTRKMVWPETKRTVILIGIRGEVPIVHRDIGSKKKKPLINPVKPGEIVVGYELHQSLALKKGDSLTLMGKAFTVSQLNTSRGNADDISIWINLKECQTLLKAEKQINAILALECNCASIDRLGEIRAEIQAILPGTEIIEVKSQAIARAEARISAKKASLRQAELLKQNRLVMREKIQSNSLAVISTLGIIAIFTISILAFNNVNERSAETGIFRAVGYTKVQILRIFLGRALLSGIVGSITSLLVAPVIFVIFKNANSLYQLIHLNEILVVVVMGPILAAIAAILPAFKAARQDPASILRNDS
ncbi:MAG: FtsX-like permease family protein [Lentisphaeraceae bacterium]|nr:FtsX-like permease family protein [Lentisphaeraceae bacterium]